ncbi:MAG: hypothetical protein ACR2I5_03575 [Candidatus Limnocylindria bacterium]
MRSFGGRVLIGLGILAAAVMTVGYAFIFSDIANPPGGDRGVLDVPPEGEVRAARLDDGSPVYVVNLDGVRVIDARGRHAPGELASMVAWCSRTQTFVDLGDRTLYAASGTAIDSLTGSGLSVLASRLDEGGQRVTVGAESGYAGATSRPDASARCLPGSWIVHQPEADEIFDPSVAVDQEAPGWIWVEGTLSSVDDAVRLCDGSGSACETWAEVRGIDPAPLEDQVGQFIGRVRDGALEGLMFVPAIGDAS